MLGAVWAGLTASPAPELADFNSAVSFHESFNHKED